ncbi:MAG: VOC family protein [Dehalococcoidales bacterium]|nr:VOC family protein [Dehalococcoidales bacterium]
MAEKGNGRLKLKSLRQISYTVKDIDKTVEAWNKYYDMGPWTYKENGGLDAKGRPWKIRMAFAYLDNVEIELVQCTEGRIFQSRFLDTWGEGIHHVGFLVDDVDKDTENLVKRGVTQFVYDPGKFSYLDAGGAGGAIFELIQKPKK